MRNSSNIDISVIVPAYNEARNLNLLLPLLRSELAQLGRYEILVVDDGSLDDTLDILKEAASADTCLKYVSLSRNFGHQAALRAGLGFASGNCAITMDADLQHPVELLAPMVEKWRSGYDVVTTGRNDTNQLPVLKRFTSSAFYTLLNWLSDVRVEPGNADFRLLDRKVIGVVNDLTECDFFLRGIIPWLGFKTCQINYDPNVRAVGATKYGLRRMASLAVSGIVSSSIRPLRLATALAAVLSLLSAVYACYALVIYFVFGWAVPGWTSVILVLSLIGAMQLLVLGIIGEYLGRTLREARKRPGFYRSSNELPRPATERQMTLAINASLLLIYIAISVSGLTLIKTSAFASMNFVLGFVLYGAGFVRWCLFLIRVPLSQAFPVAAGGLILGTQAAGWFLLGETLTMEHLVGVAIVFAGIVIIFGQS